MAGLRNPAQGLQFWEETMLIEESHNLVPRASVLIALRAYSLYSYIKAVSAETRVNIVISKRSVDETRGSEERAREK